MNSIEFCDVSHAYASQPIINGIAASIAENKITAVIGKSGSGKSTLLQFVNGLIKPSAGYVRVFGKAIDYSQLSPLRLTIGYMVQGTGLFPHLTIEQNISVAGKITKATEQSIERVDVLMKLVGLPASFKTKYPHQLSGGEQQRVGLCRALFLNPPLLLMDEPLGALDPITRHEIQTEILHLQQVEPRTILFVTHDMREATKLADYILVIDAGEVQQFDTAETVIRHPANAIVQRLIDTSLA